MLPWIVPIVVSATAIDLDRGHPAEPVPILFDTPSASGTPLFLANPTLAKITVCIYKVWISFPFMMLMASSALASVDVTVYEAARMDGAGAVQQFSRITLPIIARSTYISWILMTIFCVNDFPTIYLLTGGGPVSATTSLVVLAYRTVFEDFQVGPGVAIAFLMTWLSWSCRWCSTGQIRKAASSDRAALNDLRPSRRQFRGRGQARRAMDRDRWRRFMILLMITVIAVARSWSWCCSALRPGLGCQSTALPSRTSTTSSGRPISTTGWEQPRASRSSTVVSARGGCTGRVRALPGKQGWSPATR